MPARQGMTTVRDFTQSARHHDLAGTVLDLRSGRTQIGGPLAPWNVPVSALSAHADQTALADFMYNQCTNSAGNFNVSFVDFTFPFYYASEATGSRIVRSTGIASNWNAQTVPFKTGWVQCPGDDAQMVILDETTGIEWNFFGVTAISATHIDCVRCNRIPGDFRTREVGFPPSRGIGIQYAAMVVRPEEITAGVIRHALCQPVKKTDCVVFRAPATKAEGSPACITSGMPIGTRFSIAVTDAEITTWINALPADVTVGIRNMARMLAVALRDYGWFVSDTSGTAHFQFDALVSAGSKWAALDIPEPYESQVNFKIYPTDMLDGLITQARIRAWISSDQYPAAVKTSQTVEQ